MRKSYVHIYNSQNAQQFNNTIIQHYLATHLYNDKNNTLIQRYMDTINATTQSFNEPIIYVCSLLRVVMCHI